MRSWQPIVGILLGYLTGKYLSIAIFFLSAFPIIADNMGGASSFAAHLAGFCLLVVTVAIAIGVWLLINFFALSAWLPKGVFPCASISAVMVGYTTIFTLFAVTLSWFSNMPQPFWVFSGWV